MKRPLLPVALVYVVGLLIAEALQPPLFSVFALAFICLGLTLVWSPARAFLLWPLILVVAGANLASHTAVVSPNDLRVVVGYEPTLVTLRGTLVGTPSLRVYGQGDLESFRTLARLRVTALTRGENWQPADGAVMVSTKGDLSDEFFEGRTVEIIGVLAPPPVPLAPGLFNYRNHLARQGIYFQLKSDSPNDWRLVDSTPRSRPFTDRFLLGTADPCPRITGVG